MSQITLNIPDAQATRILAAYCAQYGYQDTVAGPPDVDGKPTTIPNPVTRLQFMKSQIYKNIKRAVIEYEGVEAQRAAIAAAADINL